MMRDIDFIQLEKLAGNQIKKQYGFKYGSMIFELRTDSNMYHLSILGDDGYQIYYVHGATIPQLYSYHACGIVHAKQIGDNEFLEGAEKLEQIFQSMKLTDKLANELPVKSSARKMKI